MITELTKEQEALIPQYLDKWVTNAHKSTQVLDPVKSREAIEWIYSSLVQKECPEIVYVTGPTEAMKYLGIDLQELNSSVWFCNWWVGWVGFYDYVLNVLFPERKEEFKQFDELTKHWTNLHAIIPYTDVCVVVQYPVSLTFDSEKRLHNPNGPAISYQDGYEAFYLTGRRVPSWVVTEEPKNWTKEQILGEKNAEVRREIIRRLGTKESILRLGAKTIDAKDYSGAKDFYTHEGRDYTLLEVDFGTGGTRKYLQMNNASVKDTHIEAVDPRCLTVEMALGYREREIEGDKWLEQNYKYNPPQILT